MRLPHFIVLITLFSLSVIVIHRHPLIADDSTASENQAHLEVMTFQTASGETKPVQTLNDWQKRKTQILANMQLVMGPLPLPEIPVPLELTVLEETTVDGILRQKIAYHTESLERKVHAYLFRQAEVPGLTAAVLCLHQTTGIGKEEPVGMGTKPNLHYAFHLAKRGYVTLAPDYPTFGEYQIDLTTENRYQSGTMRAIYDNQRALDLLQSLPEVDDERIGCLGHSLGGHNTMFTAAFDDRIKAIVSNCGFTRFHKYYGGDLRGWSSDRYMPLIRTTYQSDPNQVPFDFPEIIACFAPRAFLASSPLYDSNFEVSGVQDSIDLALPVYDLHGVSNHLKVNYPVSEHDFPLEARDVAYHFLDLHLQHTPTEIPSR
ncbi:Alpha/beta hydrolase family protein [Polystyrenella longa]|uniref:Alpha/beta hydrolase family protein n=1 Tax=Polystyrenella longa TaxID=2528007 RepID=A0A518CPF9_9PLAN|nr:alpha/beta fold hydrolase [Polystyrenella longa]QDU81102.1 Alpha/beta hydrolase family protein [Polystyrenella longa]